MASKSESKEPVNEQVVANMYGAMRSELNQIYSKITELEMEVSEHSLVINAIEPLDPSRRCYRMIGGVLVERTIKEVLPAVQRNKEGLEEVIARLNETLEKKKKEIADFETKYKIRIKKSDGDSKDESGKKEGSAQGVLVGPASSSQARKSVPHFGVELDGDLSVVEATLKGSLLTCGAVTLSSSPWRTINGIVT
ncbi:putative prefoldin subunit 2 [Hibiscus syriacus]|uniref:Prefoldin subunit 2 n=2 Tax=Hibiscus syriacus TaxID=106335 RepID=A0A6A3BNT5_HIBSY|nr:putative prefoldin subunit 2 [Hibiscus syriacus]